HDARLAPGLPGAVPDLFLAPRPARELLRAVRADPGRDEQLDLRPARRLDRREGAGMTPTDARSLVEAQTPAPIRAALALVNACPHRGGVLPVSQQPAGCAGCGELSECRAGRGTHPGRVTLSDCLVCKHPSTPGV